jgi:general secretion pathway protein F/type IV pilus assembly protein PilC
VSLFQYEVFDKRKKKCRGTIEADSFDEAKELLARQGSVLLSLRVLGQLGRVGNKVTSREVHLFTRELATLLSAQLPIFEAISALEEKYRGQTFHSLLLDLKEKIRSGQSFSSALEGYPRLFSVVYRAMIANGEKSGQLIQIVQELASWMDRQRQLQNQVIGALAYPALLFIFCIAVVSGLFFYVVPSLEPLFEGKQLYPLTRVIFALSAGMRASLPLLMVMGVLVGLMGGVFMVSKSLRRRVQKLWTKMPIFGSLWRQLALIRVSRSCSALLKGGMDLVSALKESQQTAVHPLFEALLHRACDLLTQGESLEKALLDPHLIPPVARRLLAIGCQGGDVGKSFQLIGDIYEEELTQQIRRYTALIQPLLLVVLGIVIGVVLLGVLLPLTDVGSFS